MNGLSVANGNLCTCGMILYLQQLCRLLPQTISTAYGCGNSVLEYCACRLISGPLPRSHGPNHSTINTFTSRHSACMITATLVALFMNSCSFKIHQDVGYESLNAWPIDSLTLCAHNPEKILKPFPDCPIFFRKVRVRGQWKCDSIELL